MTDCPSIPPRPPHELAAVVAAALGSVGATGLLDAYGLTAGEVAMTLCWSFGAVACYFGLQDPA